MLRILANVGVSLALISKVGLKLSLGSGNQGEPIIFQDRREFEVLKGKTKKWGSEKERWKKEDRRREEEPERDLSQTGAPCGIKWPGKSSCWWRSKGILSARYSTFNVKFFALLHPTYTFSCVSYAHKLLSTVWFYVQKEIKEKIQVWIFAAKRECLGCDTIYPLRDLSWQRGFTCTVHYLSSI